MRICMLVTNPVTRDPRVRKEARTLRDAGHEVHVVGFIHTADDLPEERLDGIAVERIDTWTGFGDVLRDRSREYRRRRKASRLCRAIDAVARSWRHPVRSLEPDYPFLGELPAIVRATGTVAARWARPVATLLPDVPDRFGAIGDYPKLVAAAIGLDDDDGPGDGEPPRRTSFSLKRLIEYNWPLLTSALRWPADVYHAHDFNTLPAAYAASRLRRARLVYDSHELWAELHVLLPKHKLAVRAIEHLLIRRCDAVITVNASIAEELARRYGIARPIVIHNYPEE